MTTAALLTLIALSLLKGAIFGALFAWLFPLLNRAVARRTGQETGQMPPAGAGLRWHGGLALLSGSGFAMIDLVGAVSDSAGLPELLRWTIAALFAVSAFGTVLIAPPKPRPT